MLLTLIPYFSATIKSTVFAIYFDTLEVRDMQFRNKSVLSMLMWIITKTFYITFWGSLVLLKLIAYFSATIVYHICDLLWHFGGPRYAISESICIIDVDVDHYKNILDYLLGVPSIGKINPIFFLQQLSPPYLPFTLTLWGSEICNFGINLYNMYS